jgi:hypothetical protein
MKAKFSSDMDGSSLRVSLFDTALCTSLHFHFIIQRGTKACEAHAASTSSDPGTRSQHPRP